MYIDIFDDWLVKTCTIKRVTNTPDGTGDYTTTKNTIYENKKCALWLTKASLNFVGGSLNTPCTYTLAIEVLDIEPEDIVIIDDVEYVIKKPDNIMKFDDIMTIGMELYNG